MRTALTTATLVLCALPAAAQVSPLWTLALEGDCYANPTVAPDGQVFYGTHKEGGRLYQIDPSIPAIVQQVDAPGPVEHSVALSDDGRLYLVTISAQVAPGHAPAQRAAACYDAETLQELWRTPLPSGADNSPLLSSDGRVYFGLVASPLNPNPIPGKFFYCLDADDGAVVYDLPVEGWGATPGVVDEQGRVFFGVEDITDWPQVSGSGVWPGVFYALPAGDPPAGQDPVPTWTFSTSGDFGSPVSMADGVVWTTCRDGKLYGFDADDGSVVFERDLGTPSWTGIAIDRDADSGNLVLYTGTQFGTPGTAGARTFFAIEVDGSLGGKLLWSEQNDPSMGGFSFGTPAIDALGNVYVTTGAGWLRARAPDGTLLWEAQLPGGNASGVGGPTILDDGTILVGSNQTSTATGMLMAFAGSGAPLSETAPWPKYKRNLRNTGNLVTPIRDGGPTLSAVSAVSAAEGGIIQIEGGWFTAQDVVLIDGEQAEVVAQDFHTLQVQVGSHDPGFFDVSVSGPLGATDLAGGARLAPTLAVEATGVGGTATTTLEDLAPGFQTLAVSAAELSAPLSLGPQIHFGLLLDPASLLVLSSGMAAQQPGEQVFSIPANPALEGRTYYLQGFSEQGGFEALSLTNLALLQL